MVREGTVSNVWTAGLRETRERGDCKIYCRRSGARVVLQFVTTLQWSGSGVTCDSVRVEAIREWTAETLVTPRASCQERDNQQEFSLRLSPPPVLHTTDRVPLGPSRVQYFTAGFTMRYTSQ